MKTILTSAINHRIQPLFCSATERELEQGPLFIACFLSIPSRNPGTRPSRVKEMFHGRVNDASMGVSIHGVPPVLMDGLC